MLILVTREPSAFFSVQSTLEYKVIKEDKDAYFSCEVSFYVPGAVRTVESSAINITVHCELTLSLFILLTAWLMERNICCLYHISCCK